MAKKNVTKESQFKDEKTITYGENGTEEQITNGPDGRDDDTGLTREEFEAAKAAAEGRVRNGKKVGTGGSVQGANLQTVATVGAFKDEKGVLHKDTLPQEDNDKMANRYLQRGLQNGDILSEDKKKSLYAERMVNKGKQFQPSKAVVKPFPDSGAAYVELLRQQGQFNASNLKDTPADPSNTGKTSADPSNTGGTSGETDETGETPKS